MYLPSIFLLQCFSRQYSEARKKSDRGIFDDGEFELPLRGDSKTYGRSKAEGVGGRPDP